MSFSEEEINEFKIEARELLDTAENSLLNLDQGDNFKQTYDALFRCFHNLKGASGIMEMHDLQKHTHELETVLMPFKNQPKMEKSYISYFLRGIDAARVILDGGAINFDYQSFREESPNSIKSEKELSKSAIDEFIAESEEVISRIAAILPVMESGSVNRSMLDEFFRDVHSLKGSSFIFGIQSMGNLAHAMESALEPIRNQTHQPNKSLMDALFQSVTALESHLDCVKKNISDEHLSSSSSELIKSLGLALQSEAHTPASPVKTPVSTPTDTPKEAEHVGSIRVPVALLDSLMNLMGEMVLVRNQVRQFSNKSEDLEFLNLSQRLNVVTTELQGEMMKTRMQPIGNVLSKFHRVVRDLGQSLKKSIQLSIEGAETELDKSLLEAIKDPLTHLVRNSCDHGIEPPEIRRKSGKPEVGHIHIKSYHEGGQVVIEIIDDGKGLNRNALIAKGIERGLVGAAVADKMSDKEVYNLIFAPGFSTAEKVTDVSGRGVGMDVVRTNVEKIGGSIDLISVAGEGTTIRLKIPLTLAIVPALIVQSGSGISSRSMKFAIPQVKLSELVRVDQTADSQTTPSQKIEWLQDVPVYRLRGNLLPLVDLNKILKLDGLPLREKEIVNIVILNADSFQFGLVVDEIQDTADIVVKPLSRLMKSINVFSGATILGDGSVALILDIPGLAKEANLRSEHIQENSISRSNTRRNTSDLEIEPQDYLLVKVGGVTKHALVLNYVHRLEEFEQGQIDETGHHRVVRYREGILPLVSVGRELGLSPNKSEVDAKIAVVVVERSGQLYGLEVDEILDTLSTSAKIDRSLNQGQSIVGNIAEKDQLIVVIDPFEIIGNKFGNKYKHEVLNQVLTSSKPLLIKSKEAHEVLLAEDLPFFRRVVKDVLEKQGYKVTLAGDGLEAWEALQSSQHNFDLLVTDIEMPKRNGFELAKMVRAESRLKELPILALSSRFDKKHTEEAAKVGIDFYLEKMSPENLLKAVEGLISFKRGAA